MATDTTVLKSEENVAGGYLGFDEWGKRIMIVALEDNTVDNTVQDGIGGITITIPEELDAFNLVSAHMANEVAGTTDKATYQIYNVTQAVDMLSTKITIDSTERTSYTASVPPVIDAANDDVATGDQIRIDQDVKNSGTAAKGNQVILTFAPA